MSLRGKRTPRLFALFRWSLASCLGQTRNSWPAGPALSSNILHQTAIKFRPPITEKAHSRAVFARAVQIERCYQCSRFLRTGFGNEVAPFISDEAVTVEDQIGRASCRDSVCQYV